MNLNNKILKTINDTETTYCIQAERSLLEAIGGDCDTAVGGLAKLSNKKITQLYHATSDICEHNYNVLMNTDWIEWYLNELDKNYDL